MLMFDLLALKAKLLAAALVLDMQLKMVVFPTLVIPIIPHCKPINGDLMGTNLGQLPDNAKADRKPLLSATPELKRRVGNLWLVCLE